MRNKERNTIKVENETRLCETEIIIRKGGERQRNSNEKKWKNNTVRKVKNERHDN